MPAASKTDELLTAMIDLDARRAQRAEAASADYVVRLGGESFSFPPVNEWPVELTDSLQKGDLMAALRLLLTDEELPRFLAQRPTMGDLNDLFEALGNRAGVGGLGNGSASASS